MAWAPVQSTSIPSAISSEIDVFSKQCGNSKRVVKMKCSLQTPPLMKVATFSGLRGVKALDIMANRSHDFHSAVTSVWKENRFKIEPSTRFSPQTKKVIEDAKQKARWLRHKFLGTEIIFVTLIEDDNENIEGKVFESMGMEYGDARAAAQAIIGRGSESDSMDNIQFTPRAQRVFEVSLEVALRADGENFIEPEHLLIGLLREGGRGITCLLRRLRLYPTDICTQLIRMVEEREKVGERSFDKERPILEEYGTSLTELIDMEELDPVVGRQTEIERVIHTLSRHKKSIPCLVGEHGVGKTSIVEGVAQELFNRYKLHEFISVDMRLLLRGKFEEKLKRLIEEAKRDCKVILFIDGVHILSGAGGTEEDIAAAKILRRALAKGDIQCIGATTPDEYQKHIENDTSLERLFQPIKVLELTVDETIKILMGLRKQYEERHSLRYTDEALIAAAELSHQLISDRLLPGKAIDIIDETGSRVSDLIGLSHSKLLEKLDCLKQDRWCELAGISWDQEIDRRVNIWNIKKRIKESSEAYEEGFNGITVTKADIEETILSWVGQEPKRLVTLMRKANEEDSDNDI